MRILEAFVAVSALVLYSQACLAAPGGGGGAKASDYVDVGLFANQSLGTWAIGDGDQVITQSVCTASANYSQKNPNPSWSPTPAKEPYAFKVTDLSTPAGYYLYLNGDDTQTGNARIAVEFDHQDTLQPVGYETLSDDVYDGHYHLGQFNGCTSGNNSDLRMKLTSTNLSKAKAGTYTGTFRAGALGGSSGTATSTANFTVTITIANAVQISNLSNINLGTWGGGADKTAEGSFCVYSNTAGASYTISVTSPNQDVSSNFFLANAGATTTIPYTLQFTDNVSAPTGTTVGATPISGVGDNNTPGCGSVNNAKLIVTILATDMQTAPTDSYGDTVTLVVVPQ